MPPFVLGRTDVLFIDEASMLNSLMVDILYQALPDSKKAGYLVRMVMSNDFYPIQNIVMGKGQGLYQTVLGNPGTSCLSLVRIATLGGLPPPG